MIKTWFLGARRQDLPIRLEQNQSANLFFRLATSADIREMLAIEREVFEEIPWTFSHFQHEITNNPRATFILAESHGKMAGYIGLRWNRDLTDFHISNFIVRKSQQEAGIGSQLLGYAEELSRNLKIPRMTLEVSRLDIEVQGFYRKRGFISSQILTAYYNDGRDAVEMEKELKLEI